MKRNAPFKCICGNTTYYVHYINVKNNLRIIECKMCCRKYKHRFNNYTEIKLKSMNI